MSDDKVLTVLHDNGNDVAALASNFYDGAYEMSDLEFMSGSKRDKRKKNRERAEHRSDNRSDESRQRWQTGPPAKPAPRPKGSEPSRSSRAPDLAVPRPVANNVDRGWGAPQQQPAPHSTQLPKELPAPSAPTSNSGTPANGTRSWAAMVAPPKAPEPMAPVQVSPPAPAEPAQIPEPAPTPPLPKAVLANGSAR